MPVERKRFGVLNGLSSTPNLLRRVGTNPTVAGALPWGVRDVFWRTAHGMCLLLWLLPNAPIAIILARFRFRRSRFGIRWANLNCFAAEPSYWATLVGWCCPPHPMADCLGSHWSPPALPRFGRHWVVPHWVAPNSIAHRRSRNPFGVADFSEENRSSLSETSFLTKIKRFLERKL